MNNQQNAPQGVEPEAVITFRGGCGVDFSLGQQCPAGHVVSGVRGMLPLCKACPQVIHRPVCTSSESILVEPLPSPETVIASAEMLVGALDSATKVESQPDVQSQLPERQPDQLQAFPTMVPNQGQFPVPTQTKPEQQISSSPLENLQQTQPQVTGPGFVIPAETLAQMRDDKSVDIDAVGAKLGMIGGSSDGGISWHTLEPFLTCERRFYWDRIVGLSQRYTPEYFAFGTLFHWTMELHRSSGGMRTFEAVLAAEELGGATAEMAKHVAVLARTVIMHYGPSEAQLWDVRAIEHNMVFWTRPVKVSGKLVRIPISCRSDLITRIKPGYNMPNLPLDHPSPEGVYILDEKTASRMSHRTIRGYNLDGQFLTNSVVFINSYANAAFGDLKGVIVSIAVKHKEPEPSKSLARETMPLAWEATQEFYAQQMLPGVTRLYEKLVSPNREDSKLWPKCIATHHCQGPYGLCPYFDVCSYGESMASNRELYKIDQSRVLKLDALWAPPRGSDQDSPLPLDTQEMMAKSIEAQAKKAAKATTRKRVSSEEKADVIKVLVAGYMGLQYPVQDAAGNTVMRLTLDPRDFNAPGVTETKVLAAVAAKLPEILVDGTSWVLSVEVQGVAHEMKFTVDKKGVSWNLPSGKATSTWKQIATIICGKWWDPASIEANRGV